MASIINSIKGGIVVSCQAHEEDGLYGPENMALMAKAAELGGAVGTVPTTRITLQRSTAR